MMQSQYMYNFMVNVWNVMHIFIDIGNTKKRLQGGLQIKELMYGLAAYMDKHEAMFNSQSIYWNYHVWRIGYL